MLTELDVVNEQLATMGEAPITSLNIPHPYVAAGIRELRKANKSVCADGWWFSTERATLTPGVSPTYTVTFPAGTLSVRGLEGQPVSKRGSTLYDHAENETITVATEVELIKEIPFRDLPVFANLYVGALAVLAFQKEFDRDPDRTRDLAATANMRYVQMNAEHIRIMQTNILARPSTAGRRYLVRGNRPVLGLR